MNTEQTGPTPAEPGQAAPEQVVPEQVAPDQTAPEQTAPEPPRAPVEHPVPVSRRPRTGPIVWGALVLAFCAYVVATVLAPGRVDTPAFVIGSVIGLGVLLLAVGAAVLVRSRR